MSIHPSSSRVVLAGALACAILSGSGPAEAQDRPGYGRTPRPPPVAGPALAAAPTADAAEPPPRRSTALMVIGIILTCGGAIPTSMGIVLSAAEEDAGPPVMIPGLLSIAAGIPLWIVGAGRVEPETAAARPLEVSAQPHPGGAALRLRF